MSPNTTPPGFTRTVSFRDQVMTAVQRSILDCLSCPAVPSGFQWPPECQGHRESTSARFAVPVLPERCPRCGRRSAVLPLLTVGDAPLPISNKITYWRFWNSQNSVSGNSEVIHWQRNPYTDSANTRLRKHQSFCKKELRTCHQQ
jgi:hypothetical protein